MNRKKYIKIRKKLQKSCVGIAGLGGLGSNAAISLARAGVGRLVLVDFDKVEESNLTRQYYFLKQIGQLKTKAMKENIKKIDPNIKVETINQKLKKGLMVKPFYDVDVVIEALDNAKTKASFIEEIMLKLPEKPIIAASGVTGYGNSDRISTKNFKKLNVVYDEEALSSDDDVLLAPRVCLIANWEANIAIEILLGKEI